MLYSFIQQLLAVQVVKWWNIIMTFYPGRCKLALHEYKLVQSKTIMHIATIILVAIANSQLAILYQLQLCFSKHKFHQRKVTALDVVATECLSIQQLVNNQDLSKKLYIITSQLQVQLFSYNAALRTNFSQHAWIRLSARVASYIASLLNSSQQKCKQYCWWLAIATQLNIATCISNRSRVIKNNLT